MGRLNSSDKRTVLDETAVVRFADKELRSKKRENVFAVASFFRRGGALTETGCSTWVRLEEKKKRVSDLIDRFLSISRSPFLTLLFSRSHA